LLRPSCTVTDSRTRAVFRELLQNSDDARAGAVEIHFETKAHVEREDAGEPAAADATAADAGADAGDVPKPKEKLPDLKTLHVCLSFLPFLASSAAGRLNEMCRCTAGRSVTTASSSATKTGRGSRRSVRPLPAPFARRWLTPLVLRAADGNPDEDKIGAFGVGACI
jgi:hypothetical protein